MLDIDIFLCYYNDMKRIRVCLSAGCYDIPEIAPANEIPILFDDGDSYHGPYNDDYLNKLQVIGSLRYLDLYRVPNPVHMEDEVVDCSADNAIVIQYPDIQETLQEDRCGPTLRGVRRYNNVSYEMEWRRRYEGFVANEFCDGKLMCFFCSTHNSETWEITNFRCVLKRGNYKRDSGAHNVKVIG